MANDITTNVLSLAQAACNSHDGIPLLQTTEEALNQVTDNLQAIKHLVVQTLNDTNSDHVIKILQQEVDQRLQEIDRIAEQTDGGPRSGFDQ